MNLPLSYNLRHLLLRRATTAMTALGIALTVAVLVAVLALLEGLRTSFASAAHPLHVLVMRKGSFAELVSAIPRSSFPRLKAFPGIAKDGRGLPLASLELVTVMVLKSPAIPGGINVTVRGLSPTGVAMREHAHLAAGRMFQEGRREIVVGKAIAARYPEARLGRKLRFGKGDWEVVGILDGGRSAFNSEIFADLNQLASDYNRADLLSSVLLRAQDPVTMLALIRSLEADRVLNVTAEPEQAYYDSQTVSALPVRYMGFLIATIMAIGSAVATMNTMYAAVARRSAEIATLRVLGFSRGAILLSFLLESLLVALAGGLVGCLLAAPLNRLQTGIGNWVTFSEIVFEFRITWEIALAGLLFAAGMGALGGLLPARQAANKEILHALRGN